MPRDEQTQQHDHQRFEVVSRCADCGQELGRAVVNRADVEAQQATALPDREEMSLVNANLAIPVNLALAANVLSDGSIAAAGAQQATPIIQSTGSSLPTV
jgi:hypothetical protein